METCVRGDIRKCLFLWFYSSLLKISSCIRRFPTSKRNIIIASACFVYLFFVFLQVGHLLPHQDKRTNRDKYKRIRGYTDAPVETVESPGNHGNTDFMDSVVPTRSNVVYITLKTKRFKPAVIRGTVRPKLRRKELRIKSDNKAFFTQNKITSPETDARRQMRTYGEVRAWKEARNLEQASREMINMPNTLTETEPRISSIRIYSEMAPPWFSKEDIYYMRFLADGKVWRIREVSHKSSPPFLLMESNIHASSNPFPNQTDQNVCTEQCGIIKRPTDNSEVFAFHLDRVLGLNRSLPAISRKFDYLQDGQPCPVVLWDAILYPGGRAADQSTVRLTWGQYQHALKQRCWHGNATPKPESTCPGIHHYEWSKLALFDFLLQIYSRLDRSCCGFKPRQEDVCVELDHHSQCGDQDRVALSNIVHRAHDPRRLVFTHNKGFFDRDEDNLDFKLLEGIKELPERAVEVLRSRRLRERLLQSLFLDQVYWDSQGGRPGIDKLIDVIERRAKVLLTYINAHGVRVIPMNA